MLNTSKQKEFTPLQIKCWEAVCQTHLISPNMVREHLFDTQNKRKWRFDFAWPDALCALEVEGGVYVRGRHTSPAGFMKDIDKYNAATLQGWRVLRAERNDFLKNMTKYANLVLLTSQL